MGVAIKVQEIGALMILQAARRQWMRRFTALLAVACLLAASVEAMALPDIHDGHATPTAPSEVAEARSLSATLHANADGQREASSAHVAQEQRGPDQTRPQAPPAPGHTSHAEHCAHGHVLALAWIELQQPADAGADGRRVVEPAPLHESVDRSPSRRPPIA